MMVADEPTGPADNKPVLPVLTFSGRVLASEEISSVHDTWRWDGLRRPDAPAAVRPEKITRLSRLRVALVHDWLTGMRGGEKCLEVFCKAFPRATLHTLIHRTGSLSSEIESMKIRTSPLQKIPGILNHYRHTLPLMPLAARSWDVGDVDLVISLSHCVAKAVRPPRVPHVCLLHAHALTPGRAAGIPRKLGQRPIRRALAEPCSTA